MGAAGVLLLRTYEPLVGVVVVDICALKVSSIHYRFMLGGHTVSSELCLPLRQDFALLCFVDGDKTVGEVTERSIEILDRSPIGAG